MRPHAGDLHCLPVPSTRPPPLPLSLWRSPRLWSQLLLRLAAPAPGPGRSGDFLAGTDALTLHRTDPLTVCSQNRRLLRWGHPAGGSLGSKGHRFYRNGSCSTHAVMRACLCMLVGACVRLCKSVSVRTRVCTHRSACVHTRVRTRACAYAHTVHTWVCTCIHPCAHVHAQVCMGVHTHACSGLHVSQGQAWGCHRMPRPFGTSAVVGPRSRVPPASGFLQPF